MFQSILSQLGGKFDLREGISLLLEKIEKKLVENKRRYIIIIDEVDKIYHNSPETPRYLFLHSLNRLQVRPRHAILLITNDFNLTKNFGSELASTMIETIFKAYNAEDILKILKLRAKHCLEEGHYKEDDLALIAKETFQNPVGGDHANIRCALNILLNASQMAQEEETNLGDTLKNSIKQVRVSDLTSLLQKYNKHLLILIKAIAQLKKESSKGIYQYASPDFNTDEIKKSFYNLIDEEGLKSPVERQFHNYIRQLTEEHFLTKINRGRYGFSENPDEILLAISKA